jgi:hypothetical protein
MSAAATRPAAATSQDGSGDKHIRRDRILHEALATGADPLHLSLVFNIDHTNAMAYANAARNLLNEPTGRDPVVHIGSYLG